MNAFGDALFGIFALVLLGFWLLSAWIARSFAAERGRDTTGLLLGLVYGPLGVIMALLLTPAPNKPRD